MITIYRTKECIKPIWNDLRIIKGGVDSGRRRGTPTINAHCVWLYIGSQQERRIITEQFNRYFPVCRSRMRQENFFTDPFFQILQYKTSGKSINTFSTTKRYLTIRSTTCLMCSAKIPTLVNQPKDINSTKFRVNVTPSDARMWPQVFNSWIIHDDLNDCIRPSYGNLIIPVNRREPIIEDCNKKIPMKRIDPSWFFSSIHKDSYDQQYVDLMTRNTKFHITILGSGAGGGSVNRSSSALLLTTKGSSYLFDAGPGLSRQIQLSRHRVKSIKYIFSKFR